MLVTDNVVGVSELCQSLVKVLTFSLIYGDKAVEQSKDGYTRCAVYVELGTDVAAMC